LNTLTEQHQRWFTGKISKWSQFWNRLGFPEIPDLRGKKLLDLGSGLGGNSYAAAKSGASVTALEMDAEAHERSQQLISYADREIFDSINFINSSVEEFQEPSQFDYIICDEVFEHLLDFKQAVNRMAELLKDNGLLCSGWGPLWASPAGGHQLVLSLAFRKGLPSLTASPKSHSGPTVRLPYSHRLLTRKALDIYSREREIQHLSSIEDMGMNGFGVTQFWESLNNSNLRIERWIENAGEHPVYKILNVMAKFPGMRELATSNVYAVLKHKPK
jgi:SAM-dependent methyltransferase